MKIKKRWFAAGVAAASFAAGAGVALAVWSANGTGSGEGGAIVAKALTVNPVAPSGPGSSLYPGGPAGWVYLTIQNQNPYDVHVTGINWGTPTSTFTTGCPSANISVDANAPTTLNLTVPANTTSGVLQIFGVLDLSHSAPDGCQGVNFIVPVTVTGAQT